MIQKQTKIVATISDLNCSIEFIKQLHHEGVDVVRLNTAHQGFADTLKVVHNVRKVSDRLALLLDTKGPELRVTKFAEPLTVKAGQLVKMTGGKPTDISSDKLIYINYKNFANEIPTGTMILIDDGDIALKVTKKSGEVLICQVQNEGLIKSNKSVNVPGVHIKLPSLSAKDKDYIQFAVDNNLDFIAHSFVRNRQDVQAIQKMLDAKKSKIKIIAKIENREGVDNIDEILDECYGIMVARGDLGIEIPAEEVPIIQKQLIKKCLDRQKRVITATQMLHTMITHPRPTRAEVSDVANAVLDGSDAVMLSGETANGAYPLEAVKVMSKIIQFTEKNKFSPKKLPAANESTPSNFLCKTAIDAALELGAKEIIVSEQGGFSARMLASYRANVPIFLKCNNQATVRRLALTYGVYAHLVDLTGKPQDVLKKTLTELVRKNKLHKKDLIIYLAGDEEATANTMEICVVGKHVK